MRTAAVILLAFLLSPLKSQSVRVWLAILGVPALVILGGLAAAFWPRQ